jgi:3-deoxy-D-manno-octulosonic-acid transferase
MFIIYNFIYFLFIIFYLPLLFIKRKFHKDILMRLGIYPKELVDKLKDRKHIWIHAVSVGEVKAASRLITELRRRSPGINLVISTVTTTGNRIAKSVARENDAVIYLPLEFAFIIKKAISLIDPLVFLTVETELWPKLIRLLDDRGIPIVVVNGRISRKSFKGYKAMVFFMKNILEKIDLFCMQGNQDAERVIALGAPLDRVKITGNIKFDLEVPEPDFNLSNLGFSEHDTLFLAGSTHNNEEEIILNIYKNLVNDFKRLKLLIAPRHIERAGQIEKMIRDRGFRALRFSEIQDGITVDSADHILLLDTVGQLQSLYNLASLVFVGGSLINKGGHNIIEPALFGKAIVIGPYMHNFSDITDIFRNAKAIIQVNNQEELAKEIKNLLDNPERMDIIGFRAKQVVQENTGAIRRTFDLLDKFLK